MPLECLADGGMTHHMPTYESSVLFVLRFMVDTGVVSGPRDCGMTLVLRYALSKQN